ncbi:MAG: hypothetical protein N2505_02115 [Endomicrobia bacterium]|nr:hypothetical protein [Endomicrobiia bacterium]
MYLLKIKKILLITSLVFFTNYLFSFNFLINLFYSILPTPIKMAFKGEGLQIDQFEYGFGNCNFFSFGYLNSDIHYKVGYIINEKFNFLVPTFYIYGGYIAHVSTPIASFVYPGWELSSEIGWGGIGYDSSIKQNYRQLFFSGSSGFNWKFCHLKKEKFGFTLNLTTGYKLHYILKDLLYWGIQTGFLLSKIISLSFEFTNTYKGGNFFIFMRDEFSSNSYEKHFALSLNFLLSEKYLLKLSGMYKNWYLKEYKSLTIEQKLNLYGVVIALISR